MATGFKDWPDEKLIEADNNGLGNAMEKWIEKEEMDIKRWQHSLKDYEQKIKDCEWLIKSNQENLADHKAAFERIQKLRQQENL